MERNIDILPRIIKSRRQPYAALAVAVTRAYQSELVTSFAEQQIPEEWSSARGQPCGQDNITPNGVHLFEPEHGSNLDLLPP